MFYVSYLVDLPGVAIDCVDDCVGEEALPDLTMVPSFVFLGGRGNTTASSESRGPTTWDQARARKRAGVWHGCCAIILCILAAVLTGD